MKTNLVTIQEAKAVTSSLQVSQTFGKEHRHVLESIRELLRTAENSALLSMFVESTYLTSQNKELPMYIINRDGFTLLAMGFTGKKALQFKIDYINAFNQMEEYIKNQSGQPTLPQRKATGKRVETYLPNEDVLRLQIAAHQEGYSSVYHLLQCLVYEFLENPYSSVGEKIKHIEQELIRSFLQSPNANPYEQIKWLKHEVEYHKESANDWKKMWQERNQFLGDILPFIQEMNRTIDEERTLRKKYEAKLRQIKQLA